MIAMYLINDYILTRFRDLPQDWQDDWKSTIAPVSTAHPGQHALMGECIEAAAALFWWAEHGSEES